MFSLPLPPGPKGLPVIGNVLDMQYPEMWEAARKWGEKYGAAHCRQFTQFCHADSTAGPLVRVEAFGTSLVYVNSYETAVDLFEKRGNIYSSRPHNTMFELWVFISISFLFYL